MANPAIVGDVEAHWRPLSAAELITAQSWLDMAWRILLVDSPGIQARIDADTVDVDLVIDILAEAVARKGKNADGKRQESVTIDDATRSWTLDASISAGELFFTPDELRRLLGEGGRRRVSIFSVMPS